MIMAIRMTLEEEFAKECKDGIEVTFRLPSGKKERKKFGGGETVQTLYDYIWMGKNPHDRFYLVDFLSKERLSDLGIGVQVMADPEDNTVMVSVIDV